MKSRFSKILPLTALAFLALGSCTPGESGGVVDSENGDDKVYKADHYDSNGNLIISFFGIDLDSLQSQTEDTKKIMDVIQKKFQVSFTYVNGSAANWQTVLNQYAGSGDLADVFFHELNEPMYSTLRQDDYLFNFEKYLDDYPNLKAAFARYDSKALKTYLGGGLYGFPIVQDDTTDSDIVNQHGMYYRRDWYDNLVKKGYVPKSGRSLVDPEDPSFNYLNFYDLCEGYTYGDPDGNGKRDTYGYALTKEGGGYWFYPILSLFGVAYDTWSYDDGKGLWQPDCISDQTKEALDFMAKMYDEGLLSQNYATSLSQTQMKNEYINGQAGMMSFNTNYNIGEGILELMEQYTTSGIELKDVCRAMPAITGTDGKKHVYGYSNRYGFRSINDDVSPTKKKKIMEIMDWMLTEEGMDLLNYGIEGVHYEVGANGEKVSLLGKNANGVNRSLYDSDCAPGIYRIKGLVSWSTIIPTHIKHYEEQMQLINAWEPQYLFANPLRYCSVDPSFGTRKIQLDDQITSAFQYIVGKHTGEERDAKWSSYVSKYASDARNYIIAMNQSAEEIGVSHNG